MSMDVRNKKFIIINVFIVIILFLYNSFHEDKIFKDISSSVKTGDIIALNDFTDFDWNNVVLCNPGTSKKVYEQILGLNKFRDFDLRKVVIFRNNETVVKTIVRNYHPEKYLSVEFYISINSYTVLNKEEALFKVRVTPDCVELHPLAEIMEMGD